MKCKILFFILVSALCCTGCGGKKPVSGADARQVVSELGIQKFEVALNELIVQPFPDPSDQREFNALYPTIMKAPTHRYRPKEEPKFMKDLDALVQRDLGVGIEYQKMAQETDIDVTKKPGFVWDPELFWPIASKEVSAGDNTIEIYTKVLDSSHDMDPSGLSLETFIRVKSGSQLLKEYRHTASFHSRLDPRLFKLQLSEYFIHIPEMLAVGMGGAVIGNYPIEVDIEWVRKQRTPPPEEELLEMKDMIQDAWDEQNMYEKDPAEFNPPYPVEEEKDSEEAGATLLE